MSITRLAHAKVTLALHQLQDGPGRPLLLLHGLGGRSPKSVPEDVSGWPGPIHALDFTGHGQSTVPRGGGYTCEVLMGDADTALAHLGPCTVVGRGVGAYVALLIAGARPTLVRGAVLADGAGLAGGGGRPSTPLIHVVDPDAVVPPDPWALAELSSDVRPPDYANSFAHQTLQLSNLLTPLVVAAVVRPPWLEAVVEEPGVVEATVPAAVAIYADAR